MAWIDYGKAFDMVPHSRILVCKSMFGIAKYMKEFLKNNMANWKTELFVDGQSLGQDKIKRGILQGDSLSSFVIRIVHDTPDIAVKANESWVSIQRN